MAVTNFKTIKRTSNLYEDVVVEVKEAILSGRCQAGDALPSEAELTRQFGVSRPVVREALRHLQSRGFLEIRRGTKGGAFVCDLRKLTFVDDFADLIRFRKVSVDHLAQVRMFVEPEVCRLAAVNATKQDLLKMKNLLKGYKTTKDRSKLDLMYSEFHRLVGRACGNPIYAIIMESILDFTDGFIKTIKPVSKIIHRDDDHDEILLALEERDPERAAEVAARHASHILGEMKKLEETYIELLNTGRSKPSAN